MRLVCALVLGVGLQAQTPSQPGSSDRPDLEKIRILVEAGALPRTALDEAEAAREDVRDEETLKSTLYGRLSVEELNEDQCAQMVAAAGRRLARSQRKLAGAERLVAEGVASRYSLTPYLEEVDFSRKTLSLATMRANLLRQLSEIVEAEQELAAAMEEAPAALPPMVERFDGAGVLTVAQLRTAVLAFEREFGKPLPVSANGGTALHRAMGFDHRGRVDVALYPDSPEGVWLRDTLERLGVPYYAFRGRVPGKATAAHIHIGPPSLRLRRGD